jgi:hypothetical protein
MSSEFVDADPPRMSVEQYRNLTARCTGWTPNPFAPYPGGAWDVRAFPQVVDGVCALLARFDAGKVDERQLLRGKDNDKRIGPNGLPLCQDTLSHWLYFQHHKGDERWKLLGQRYWSVAAFLSWRAQYQATAPDQRLNRNDGMYSLRTFPKGGSNGLVSEHVVPKKAMKALLLPTRDEKRIGALLRLNLCCVVTSAEDSRLERDGHPDPIEPWRRYRGKGIILLHNPAWTDNETASLLRNDLLSVRSVNPFG